MCWRRSALVTHKFGTDARLAQGVARARDHLQLRLGPAGRQTPGRMRRTDHVIASLHDRARDLGDEVHVIEDLTVALQKSAIDEIVILKPGNGAGVVRGAFTGHAVILDRGERIFPGRPGPCMAGLHDQIAGEEPLVICRDQIAALAVRDRFDETFPDIGPELRRPAAIEPAQLGLGHQEDATQHHVGDAVGMALRIDQRQRRPPTAAEDDPAVDLHRLADPFDIADQMPGGVLQNRRVRARPPAAALVEQDHTVDGGIEVPAHGRAAASAGPTMEHDDRNPVGIAALLDIDPVPLSHVQHTLIERIGRRIQKLRCGFRACQLLHSRTI